MADNEPFAYRLEVRVEPQWAEIIRRVVGLRDEKEQREFGARIVLQDDRILHRNYDFTEFFDTQTGLTTKFQSAHFNGKTYSRFVKEFCDSGYLFGRDSLLMPMAGDPQYQIAITESSIGTHCFDPHGGQLDLTGPKLSKFPIDAIVEFGVALQLRFPELNTNNVIKWPDNIEAALQRTGTKYHDMWSYTPTEFEMEKQNQEFFGRYGRPRVATFESRPAPYFLNPCCYYSIDLRVFTPQSARQSSRLAWSHFEGGSLLGDNGL